MRHLHSTTQIDRGNLLGVYRTPLRWSDWSFLSLVLAFAALLVWLSLRTTGITFGLVLLVLGIIGYILIKNIVDIYHTRLRRVCVYTHCVVEQHPRSEQVCFWHNVAYVWNYTYRSQGITAQTLRLQQHDGHSLTVEDVVSRSPSTTSRILTQHLTLQQLGEFIEEQVLPRLTEAALAHYTQGAAIDFGAFSVSQAGIMFDQHIAHWPGIDDIVISDEMLIVRQANCDQSVLTIPVMELPNVPVLIALLRQHHGDRYQITQYWSYPTY